MNSNFEIQTLDQGSWQIASVFDNQEEAVYEAKRLSYGGRIQGIRVIQEDIEGNPFAPETEAELTVIFKAGVNFTSEKSKSALSGKGAGYNGIPEIDEMGRLIIQDPQRTPAVPRVKNRRRRRKTAKHRYIYTLLWVLLALFSGLVVGLTVFLLSNM